MYNIELSLFSIIDWIGYMQFVLQSEGHCHLGDILGSAESFKVRNTDSVLLRGW